jgi:uncharacterized membrane protein YfcA
MLIYGMDPNTTVAVSLCAVFANAVSSTVAYGRQGRVDYSSGWRFALAVIPGSLVGAFVVKYIPVRVFSGAFGALFFFVSLFMAFAPARTRHRSLPRGPGEARLITDSEGHRFSYRVRMSRGIPVSFAAGALSSLMGIGGGVIHVPAMILWLGFPHHIAVATSTFIISVSSLIGAAAFASQGAVAWGVALPIAAGAVIGAQIGARIARSLSGRWVGRLLALALCIIGIRMLISSVVGH